MDNTTAKKVNEKAALANFWKTNRQYPGTHTFVGISPENLDDFRSQFSNLKFEPSVSGKSTSVTIIQG